MVKLKIEIHLVCVCVCQMAMANVFLLYILLSSFSRNLLTHLLSHFNKAKSKSNLHK